jgi:hypothetical protein
MNIKSEIEWSQCRMNFSPGFKNVLDWGVNKGLYDVDNNLQGYEK